MLTKYVLTWLIFIFAMTACATEEGLTSLPSGEATQTAENTALTPLTNDTSSLQTPIEESPAPIPTLLPTQEPVEVESPSCSKNALFIADVTIPDGTVIEAGEGFEKIWRVKNTGSCPWLDAYQWRFVGGESAGAPTFVPINGQVPPDSEYELVITFTAPQLEQGTRELYSQWQLHDEHGTPFGDQIYLVINVAANKASLEPQPPPEEASQTAIYQQGTIELFAPSYGQRPSSPNSVLDLDTGSQSYHGADIQFLTTEAGAYQLRIYSRGGDVPYRGLPSIAHLGTTAPNFEGCQRANLAPDDVEVSPGDDICVQTDSARFARLHIDATESISEGSLEKLQLTFVTWEPVLPLPTPHPLPETNVPIHQQGTIELFAASNQLPYPRRLDSAFDLDTGSIGFNGADLIFQHQSDRYLLEQYYCLPGQKPCLSSMLQPGGISAPDFERCRSRSDDWNTYGTHKIDVHPGSYLCVQTTQGRLALIHIDLTESIPEQGLEKIQIAFLTWEPLFGPAAGPTPTPFPESAPPTPVSIVPAPPLTIEALENGEYQANNDWVAEETVKLTNNSYRTVNEPLGVEVEVRLSEAKGFGDLNADGSLDAVVVLVFEPLGPTGTFVHLAAVINENGTPRHVATLLLGDRTPVHAIWFEGDQIMVDLTIHGPTDPLCCASIRMTQRYQLQGERLVLLSN